MPDFQFTSESVSEGHPDKAADQISDSILDEYLRNDPDSKVACECLITSGHLVIAGEVNSTAQIDALSVAKETIKNIGYTDESSGFNYDTAEYISYLHQQSHEINKAVSNGGAGDQGLMFGYACNETKELMPLPIMLAHKMVERQSQLRKDGSIEWLLPDAKSQVTVFYENDKPLRIDKVVLSTQHKSDVTQDTIREFAIEKIITPVLEAYLPGSSPEYFINPSGRFTVGGPHGDTGLTGRKIIVDTYGGSCPHGGGAFSGKDPSKVDRSGAYAARYAARHVVASKLADRCTIQVSYAIGVADPTSVFVNTHGTGKISDNRISDLIVRLLDFTPEGIINKLNLKNPIYSRTAAYGHFGKSYLPWEQTDNEILQILMNSL